MHVNHSSIGMAEYISALMKLIDKYLKMSWLGKSQLDRLLEDQLKQGAEQIYLAYTKPLSWFIQSKIDHPFTTVGIYKESTNESEINREIDGYLKSGGLNVNSIRAHLESRRNSLLRSCKLTFGTELFEIYSMVKLVELQASPSKSDAFRLKAIMDRNIFSEGVTLANRYLPEQARRNKLFRLHFHVGDDYIPASTFDMDFAGILPFVVCSYSRTRNRTEVSLLYKVIEMESGSFLQGNEKTAFKGRGVKRVVGYYDNHKRIPALARPFLDKPEMSVRRLSDHEYEITCRTQAPPSILEVWEFEDQTGIYRGSMKGTDSDDIDPPGFWRDYTRLDPMTFQVKYLARQDTKNPVFYFFNQDYLGAAAFCDNQERGDHEIDRPEINRKKANFLA